MVELTLKATGVELGFFILRISETSWVKGRRKPSSVGSISTDMILVQRGFDKDRGLEV